MTIPFNKPFVAGKELYHIAQAVTFGNLGGDGYFTKKCVQFMEERFAEFKAPYLTVVAIREALEQVPNARLLMVEDGYLQECCRSLA
jgi:hypothetical protein